MDESQRASDSGEAQRVREEDEPQAEEGGDLHDVEYQRLGYIARLSGLKLVDGDRLHQGGGRLLLRPPARGRRRGLEVTAREQEEADLEAPVGEVQGLSEGRSRICTVCERLLKEVRPAASWRPALRSRASRPDGTRLASRIGGGRRSGRRRLSIERRDREHPGQDEPDEVASQQGRPPLRAAMCGKDKPALGRAAKKKSSREGGQGGRVAAHGLEGRVALERLSKKRDSVPMAAARNARAWRRAGGLTPWAVAGPLTSVGDTASISPPTAQTPNSPSPVRSPSLEGTLLARP